MFEREIRVLRKPAELRATKGNDGGDVFSGYVFKWDQESDDLGGFTEVIRRGAAAKALAMGKTLFAVLDHEKTIPNVLGDNSGPNPRLRLWEDEAGLAFRIESLPTSRSRDAAMVISPPGGRGADVGMSFAFINGTDRWSMQPGGKRLRELIEFRELDDISIVVDAAYKSSDVTVAKRSLQAAIAAGQLESPPSFPPGENLTAPLAERDPPAADISQEMIEYRDAGGNWITVNGTHILVAEGQSKADAVKSFTAQHGSAQHGASAHSGVTPEHASAQAEQAGKTAYEAGKAAAAAKVEGLKAKGKALLSSVAAKLHGVAANYHQIAADAHRLVGSKEKAAEHAQQAGMHLAEAGKHAAVVADYAKGLSAKAEKSGKKSDHAAAWNAHQAAAAALHAAGLHKTAEAHEATAKGHQVAATQKGDLFAQLGREAAAKGKIPAGAAGGPAKAKKKGKRAALENGDVEYRDLDAGGPDAAELLSRILAILRGLEVFFHSAHWQSRGPNFYGSHLMFERLYQSVADAIDALGERMVKHLGPDAVDAAALAQAAAAAVAGWPADSALSGGLAAEIELQQAIRTAYEQLKAAGQLSPGMDDFLLSLADEHETNLYLLKQAAAPEVQARYAGKDLSVETRNKPDQGRTPGEKQETPTVEVLTRRLDLLELEHRCNIGTSYPLNGLAEVPKPTHNLMAMRAHGATDDCMRAKRQSGAPSRALELRAAAAHDLAASSAAAERKTAAAAFHTAMAGAHRAAADDQYAAEYQPDGPSYRSLGVRSGVERRENPHHDEDGLFHSGLPHEILSAAAGRMQKAEARHAAAVGDEKAQPETRCELRDAHQASIAAAQDALEEADEAWGQLQEEHRAAIAVSQGALEELGKNQALYGGQASTSPTPTDAHASDAPIE